MRNLVWMAFVSLLGVCLACGSGGSSDEKAIINDTLSASFLPDVSNPGPGTVTLAESGVAGDLVTLAVNVTGVDDIFGASFDVAYDHNVVQYVNHAPGSLLESEGHDPTYWITPPQVLASDRSRIVVGIAGEAGRPPVDVDIDEALPLVNLIFRVLQEGASDIEFESADLLEGANPDEPQAITGLDPWAGGVVLGE